jgi:hypothetical protein
VNARGRLTVPLRALTTRTRAGHPDSLAVCGRDHAEAFGGRRLRTAGSWSAASATSAWKRRSCRLIRGCFWCFAAVASSSKAVRSKQLDWPLKQSSHGARVRQLLVRGSGHVRGAAALPIVALRRHAGVGSAASHGDVKIEAPPSLRRERLADCQLNEIELSSAGGLRPGETPRPSWRRQAGAPRRGGSLL